MKVNLCMSEQSRKEQRLGRKIDPMLQDNFSGSGISWDSVSLCCCCSRYGEAEIIEQRVHRYHRPDVCQTINWFKRLVCMLFWQLSWIVTLGLNFKTTYNALFCFTYDRLCLQLIWISGKILESGWSYSNCRLRCPLYQLHNNTYCNNAQKSNILTAKWHSLQCKVNFTT